jgi:cyclopropane-fatty-acyl-phospholipid synthase
MNHNAALKQPICNNLPNLSGLPLMVRFFVARLHKAGTSTLNLKLSNGELVQLGQHRDNLSVDIPTLEIINHRAFLRAYVSGMMGWAEGYMAGDWTTPNLIQLTEWAAANEQALKQAFKGSFISTIANNLWHWSRNNSLAGSRRNIAYHYDLGNDFYQLWLDETMTYSSALFETPNRTLAQAQEAKYQKILSLSDISPTDRLLEVGCGWGGLADIAAQTPGLHYRGITLSKEQLVWAKERVAHYDQPHRVNLEYCDYRDIEGQYDRIISIEMFEAVGEEHWDQYFQMLNNSLTPGGNAVLQIICIAEERFEHYRTHADFIQRYIFPGGMLPSASKIESLSRKHHLSLGETVRFGQDYATTLKQWRENFTNAWPQIANMGYDERFRKMWEYYLAYCESGFRHQALDVLLFKINKPA